MKKDILIYTISDSLGETSQKLISAVAAQYPNLNFNCSYRFPFVTKEEELIGILKDAVTDDAMVVSTLVNKDLVKLAQDFAKEANLAYLDLMHPFFDIIESKTGDKPIEEPGTVHRLDTAYFDKISAMEFAVKYDDGKNPHGFIESDIVILGVSRTSKTPLSLYLANKGYKVSNLPLIPEVPLPSVLDEIDPGRIIGLTCQSDTLAKIRRHRLDTLGLKQTSSYTNMDKIYEELNYANEVFQKYGAYVIDVTDKSIEEMTLLVEKHIKALS